MTISEEILVELPKGVERPEEFFGDAGLMKELKIRLMERMYRTSENLLMLKGRMWQ